MKKDFDKWNEKKKKIHNRVFNVFVHTREVWWCALGTNVGVEADGKHDNFERPVLVVRKFSREAVLVVPVTTKVKRDNVYHAVYLHEGREFSAVLSQLRLISTKRLIRKVFVMDSGTFGRILDLIGSVIINKRPPLSRGSRRPHGH